MSTFRILASSFAWAYNNSTSWTWDGAFQGAYGNTQPRNGVIFFNNLRSSVPWADMNVTAVRFWVQFGDAGGAHKKVLSIFGTAYNSVSGHTGAAMRGVGICQVRTATSAWKTSETLTFDSANNAFALPNWKTWLEDTTSIGLCLYLNESAPSANNYSQNYLIVTNAGMEIDYEPKGSTGTISPDPVEIGDTVTLDIAPIASDEVVTHTAEWTLGETSSGPIAIAAGVTQATYTLPSSWLGELDGVTSGEAVCTLTTYVGGVLRGAREIPFTAAVPAGYAPVINSFSVKRYASAVDDQGQTVYVESLSGNHVWVNISATIDRDGGLNPGTASIRYYPDDDEEHARTVALTWSGDDLTHASDRSLITETIDLSRGWVFELTVTNGHTSETATARVEKSWAPLHIAGSGYGVGVGMYSDGVQAAPRFQVGWPAELLGGIQGVTNFSTDEIMVGRWIDGSALYVRTIAIPITTAGADTMGSIGDDVDKVLRFDGVLITTAGSQRPINWYHSATLYCDVYRYQTQNSIAARAGETGTAYVTILYTKISV